MMNNLMTINQLLEQINNLPESKVTVKLGEERQSMIEVKRKYRNGGFRNWYSTSRVLEMINDINN